MPMDPLPDVLVIAPYRTVLHRGEGTAQLGLDPDDGVEVRGLSAGLTEMLRELERPVVTAGLLDRCVASGVRRDEAIALLGGLVARGALVDAIALRRVEALRQQAVVVVRGDGPLAIGVAIALAAAGVGTVHVCAEGTVSGPDVGRGYAAADRGRPRWAVAAEAVRAAAPGQVRTGPPPGQLVPDLAVLTDALVTDVTVVDTLLARGVPHLAVRLRDGRGVIGPLVLPGRTSCLRCLDLHRSARDPHWPLVAAQLTGRTGLGSPACAGAAAALAAEQALVTLEGAAGGRPAPAVLNTALEFDIRSAVLRRRPVAPRPDCRCRVFGGVGWAEVPVRETIER